MKPPLAGYKDNLPPNARAILDHVLQCSAVGTVDDIAAGLKAFQARTGADEIIVASSMYDHGARKHSVALAIEAAKRSEEHTSELQSLMRISYAVFCLQK